MDPKVEALAQRLKGVLDEYEAGRREHAAAREERLAEARAARSELLEELAAFGRAVGHLQVDAHSDRVAYSWGSQRIAFVPAGDGDLLRVVLGGLAGADEADADTDVSPVRIYRDPARDGAWVLGVEHDGVEDTEPLIERGLVHLLVEGLGLPVPRRTDAQQPPLDDLVPKE